MRQVVLLSLSFLQCPTGLTIDPLLHGGTGVRLRAMTSSLGHRGSASGPCATLAPVNRPSLSLPGPRVSPWSYCFLYCCHWAHLGTQPPNDAHRSVSATIPGGMWPAGTRTSLRCPMPSLRSAGRGGGEWGQQEEPELAQKICHCLGGRPWKVTFPL